MTVCMPGFKPNHGCAMVSSLITQRWVRRASGSVAWGFDWLVPGALSVAGPAISALGFL